MRVRLRPAYSDEELRAIYPLPHDHTRWPDHLVRVEETIELARQLCPLADSVADLSCGDAAIARAVATSKTALILGDLAPGYQLQGPIEETIHGIGQVDLFICSETVEHLDDPDNVLANIRRHAAKLVLSTPLAETAPINPEHYWGWDEEGVRDMLKGAGWEPVLHWNVLHPLAHYQLWGCE